jgi:hypothetical protein
MEYTFIYSAAGEAIGFAHGHGIYDLSGRRVGQLKGTHVHAIRGAYVGELSDGRVVDKQMGNFGNVGAGVSDNFSNPRNPPNDYRSPSYRYPDMWSRLFW